MSLGSGLLKRYCTTNTSSRSGALYALGLINVGCGSHQPVEDYLREAMKTSQGEVVQHCTALGLGIAGMGGRSSDSYDSLKETLFTDFVVAGEAAGYAMGLVMLGSADPTRAEEMLTYAKETHHEKIIRGLAMGLAFFFYGRQEESVVEQPEIHEGAGGMPERSNFPSKLLSLAYPHSPSYT